MHVTIKNSIIKDFVNELEGDSEKNRKLVKYLALIGLDRVADLQGLSRNEGIERIKKIARDISLKRKKDDKQRKSDKKKILRKNGVTNEQNNAEKGKGEDNRLRERQNAERPQDADNQKKFNQLFNNYDQEYSSKNQPKNSEFDSPGVKNLLGSENDSAAHYRTGGRKPYIGKSKHKNRYFITPKVTETEPDKEFLVVNHSRPITTKHHMDDSEIKELITGHLNGLKYHIEKPRVGKRDKMKEFHERNLQEFESRKIGETEWKISPPKGDLNQQYKSLPEDNKSPNDFSPKFKAFENKDSATGAKRSTSSQNRSKDGKQSDSRNKSSCTPPSRSNPTKNVKKPYRLLNPEQLKVVDRNYNNRIQKTKSKIKDKLTYFKNVKMNAVKDVREEEKELGDGDLFQIENEEIKDFLNGRGNDDYDDNKRNLGKSKSNKSPDYYNSKYRIRFSSNEDIRNNEKSNKSNMLEIANSFLNSPLIKNLCNEQNKEYEDYSSSFNEGEATFNERYTGKPKFQASSRGFSGLDMPNTSSNKKKLDYDRYYNNDHIYTPNQNRRRADYSSFEDSIVFRKGKNFGNMSNQDIRPYSKFFSRMDNDRYSSGRDSLESSSEFSRFSANDEMKNFFKQQFFDASSLQEGASSKSLSVVNTNKNALAGSKKAEYQIIDPGLSSGEKAEITSPEKNMFLTKNQESLSKTKKGNYNENSSEASINIFRNHRLINYS